MQRVMPLDPQSPRGRQLAEELTELLGRIYVDVARRRAERTTTTDARRAAA